MSGDREVNELLNVRERLEKKFAELTTMEPGHPKFEILLSELESAVVLLEQGVMKIDNTMPMGWFRGHFNASKFSSEGLADYAALIGRYAGDDPARLDRAQLLLTRLMISFLGGDAQALASAHIRTLLAEALPPSLIDTETRGAAIEFFKTSAARIAAFRSLEELTRSSFFLDVRGYKLSLRKGVLDPEVMAAAIELNQTVNESIDKLAKKESRDNVSFDEHMKGVDLKIRALFKDLRTDDSREVEQFEDRIKTNLRLAAKTGLITFDETFKARNVFRWVAAATILIGSVLLWIQTHTEKPLTLISLSETESISPWLVTATVVPPPPSPARLMIGRINKRKWAVLNASQRSDVAHTLAETMKSRGMIAATVMLEDQVVIQIESGTVLIAQ